MREHAAAASDSDGDDDSSPDYVEAAAGAAYSKHSGAPTKISEAGEQRLANWVAQRHAAALPVNRGQFLDEAAKLAVEEGGRSSKRGRLTGGTADSSRDTRSRARNG